MACSFTWAVPSMWTPELEKEVWEYLQRGLRIEAINLVRQRLMLRYMSEAREMINNLEERMRLQFPDLAIMPSLPDDLHEEVRSMLPDKKIEAIKEVREVMGYGLKQAKDAVEDIQYNRIPWPDVNWFTYFDVKKLVAENKKPHAAKRLAEELGCEMDAAFKVADAIAEGRIPLPERPPKYRSIDDE